MIKVAAVFVSEHGQGFQSDVGCGTTVVTVGITIGKLIIDKQKKQTLENKNIFLYNELYLLLA